MKRKKIFILFLIFCFCIYPISRLFAEYIDNIEFVTEHFPPFNFKQNNQLQGISVDLLLLILEEMGSKQTRQNIKLLPWARGYKLLQYKKNTCLFTTSRSKKRESQFKWAGPIFESNIGLISRKDRKISINSIEDIKKYKIGVVIEDIGEQLLTNAGIDKKILRRYGGVDASNIIIHLLSMGRLDAWSMEEFTAKWMIKENGLRPDDYEVVYFLSQKGSYCFAFHKSTSDLFIKKFQNAFDKIKKEGKYQKVLDKYLK